RQRLCELPAEEERHQRQRHPDERCRAAADAIGDKSHHRPEERSAEQRDGGQQSTLGGREMQLGFEERRERPEQHPHHEAEVGGEKGPDQRGCVTCLQESFTGHAAAPFVSIAGSPTMTMLSSTRTGYVETQWSLPCVGRSTQPSARFTFHACSGQTTDSP